MVNLTALTMYNSICSIGVFTEMQEIFFRTGFASRLVYMSAVHSHGVWDPVDFPPVDHDKMEAFLKHSKVDILAFHCFIPFHYYSLYFFTSDVVGNRYVFPSLVVILYKPYNYYDNRATIPCFGQVQTLFRS